jgi:SAM-dependent methyltransferase
MPAWLVTTFISLMLVLAGTALFFFLLTRGALLVRAALAAAPDAAAHVYPIYSNMRLIRLIDFQPISSAILLFQYNRLVSGITGGLRQTDLRDKSVLITSCAFGNVIPRVVATAIQAGARRVLIADLIHNELEHAQGKLKAFSDKLQFLQQNANAMKLADGAVAVNVIFFLLHELPDPLKVAVLSEAGRVLAPGGKLYLAEFHRPDAWLMRGLSWTYFKVFEPLSLALWSTHDPLAQLQAMGGFSCERRTFFFGNFQIIVATKNLVR